jgi:energy-coupling factor transport system permease protein
MRFDSYHPVINLLYFTAVLLGTVFFRHPIYLAISFVCAFCYCAKLRGWRGVCFGLILLPLMALFTLWYASYHHFGLTVLRRNFIGNAITLESLAYGLALSTVVAAVLLWFACIHAVFCTDKILYLFSRLSPRLSLYLSVLLRTVPRLKRQGQKVNTAQQAIGRGTRQGNLLRRIVNFFRQGSILLTWLLENFVDTSDAMRSRGVSLRGRTAYSLYRFDNRDRGFVLALFVCFTAMGMAAAFDQVNISYNPVLLAHRTTPLSIAFYGFYTALCLLPLALQLIGEIRWKRLQSTAKYAA